MRDKRHRDEPQATVPALAPFFRENNSALQQAKFDFWENDRTMDEGAKLPPFFGAGFVAIGDMQPLK